MKKLILGLALFAAVSCKTVEYVEVPVEKVKIEYVTVNTRDTVIQRDSIDRYVKGDSVLIYKYKYLYKYTSLIDTVIKTDTITVPYALPPEIKEVNVIKGWQKFLMICGVASLLLICYKLYRKFKI